MLRDPLTEGDREEVREGGMKVDEGVADDVLEGLDPIEGEGVFELVGEMVGVGDGEFVPEDVKVGVRDGVSEDVGERVGVGEEVGDTVEEGVSEGVSEGEAPLEGEGVPEGVSEGVDAEDVVCVADGVAVTEGTAEVERDAKSLFDWDKRVERDNEGVAVEILGGAAMGGDGERK